MTAIELLNQALLKIGVSKGVAAITEQSQEAYTGALVFDHTLRATLRHFPWSFATKYLALTQTQGPASSTDDNVQAWSAADTYAIGDVVDLSGTFYFCILAHLNQTPPNATYWSTTTTERANGDWDYAYRWPSDCLFARRFVPEGGHGRVFSETPITYRVGRDKNGLLLYTHQRFAVLEYTAIDCDALWGDDLFIDAFTWRLAAFLAPSLSKIPDMAKTAYALYEHTLARAAAVSSQESQTEKPGDAEWTNAR